MDDLKKWYRSGLATRLEALRSARREFAPGGAARDSVCRIARLLKDTGSLHGFPEISRAAAEVEQAAAGEFESALDQLLLVLEKSGPPEEEEKTTLLVIDDDPAIGEVLRAVLGGRHREVLTVGTAREAEILLEDKKVDLILLDLILPDTDGRNFLLRLKENAATATVPVLVLSAKIGVQPKTECFALGADAYFEKPFEIDTLSVTVSSWLHRSEGALRESRRDALTGLPNRPAFREAFARHASLAQRKGEPLAVAILDLDRFKRVNDTFGHRVGDDVLRRTAAVISRSLRKSDFLARWGGEEFVVLFPNTDVEGAANAMRKSLECLQAEEFQPPEGALFHVSFSAGVAAVDSEVGVDEVVAAADKHLYLAKAGGRCRVVTHRDQPGEQPQSVLLGVGNSAVAEVIRYRLQRDGFEVEHTRDAPGMITAVRGREFSVAILDANLPGQKDLELVNALRAGHGSRRLAVLLLTTPGEERILSRGFELGVDDYIVEPFSPMELLTRVRSLVRRA